MERRRAIIAAQDGFIPPEYQKYDYLETPYNAEGYASVDTGVPGNNNNLVIETNVLTVERRSYGRIFGSWDSENNACWRFIQYAQSAATRYYIITANNRMAGASYTLLCVPSGKTTQDTISNIKIEYGKGTATVGDYTATVEIPPDGSAVSNKNIGIGVRSAGDTTNGTAKVRFYYYFRIFDGTKLIRNYVPVVRKSDNKPGFYDTVNFTFNPSVGTRDFIAGND